MLFAPEKLKKYPHLMVNDVAIWERYLDLHAVEWDSFEYDVRVGEGQLPNPAHPKNIQLMAVALSEKRIDVVGRIRGRVWIIEVKPSAMLSAVGQLISYQILYEERFPGSGSTELLIVTDRIGPDLENLCKKFRISIAVV
jgi:hypothetical protein